MNHMETSLEIFHAVETPTFDLKTFFFFKHIARLYCDLLFLFVDNLISPQISEHNFFAVDVRYLSTFLLFYPRISRTICQNAGFPVRELTMLTNINLDKS